MKEKYKKTESKSRGKSKCREKRKRNNNKKVQNITDIYPSSPNLVGFKLIMCNLLKTYSIFLEC